MSENDIYCQSRKQTLIEELIAGTNESSDAYKDFSLHQLEQIKAKIAANKIKQTTEAKRTEEQAGKTLTIGNSLFGFKMSEIPGQPNTVNPGLPIGNQLFNKRINEV